MTEAALLPGLHPGDRPKCNETRSAPFILHRASRTYQEVCCFVGRRVQVIDAVAVQGAREMVHEAMCV
jgi:hypothetical protein